MTIRQVVFLSIGKGSAGPWHLEPIFVDFETLDFRIESSRGQPESRGGAGWARDLSITLRNCGFDDFLLLPLENTNKRTHAPAGMSECSRQWQPRKMYQCELGNFIK